MANASVADSPDGVQSGLVLQTLLMLGQRLIALEEKVTEIHQTVQC